MTVSFELETYFGILFRKRHNNKLARPIISHKLPELKMGGENQISKNLLFNMVKYTLFAVVSFKVSVSPVI